MARKDLDPAWTVINRPPELETRSVIRIYGSADHCMDHKKLVSAGSEVNAILPNSDKKYKDLVGSVPYRNWLNEIIQPDIDTFL